MRFLFLVLTLLGLVGYGDSIGRRSVAAAPHGGHRSAARAPQSSPADVVVIAEDGTPMPRH